MRLFVAVFPPPEVSRAALDAAHQALAGALVGASDVRIRWTPAENVHLTLKFLGEVPEGEVPGISSSLAAVCSGLPPFDAQLSGGLGAFPSARRAQVVWAGVGAGTEELASLAAGVEASLAELGFPPQRGAYKPHITLGRVRGRPARLDLPPLADTTPGFRVERVRLVESRLGPDGPSYREVEGYPLGGARSG